MLSPASGKGGRGFTLKTHCSHSEKSKTLDSSDCSLSKGPEWLNELGIATGMIFLNIIFINIFSL